MLRNVFKVSTHNSVIPAALEKNAALINNSFTFINQVSL